MQRSLLFSQEFEEENEYKTHSTITKNGIKIIGEYRNDYNNSIIEFMQDDRFYIKGIGTNMDLYETRDAIQELESDELG